MKIHRFIGGFDLNKSEFEITGDIAGQIIRVLKLKTGEKIELCDGKSISAVANIYKIEKNKVMVKIEEILENKKIEKKVVLFCSVLKKENFEMVVQKATECGVIKIVPIISVRTVKTGLNLERLKKIAKEASEQSGRITIPEISETISFEKSLGLIKKEELNILFDISGEKYPCVSENNSPLTNIWIGPEGGWTPDEIEKAKNLNFKIFSLGPLTLRGETAAIVATYLLAN